MADELLLVGSIPLETVEEVFRTFGKALGTMLPYVPDGEIGDRQYWIDGIAYRVFNGHPEIETLKRPAPDNGVERWRPRNLHDQFSFRVKDDVKEVRFGDPGWRLGYAKDAINSYFIFRKLKEEGVIPAGVRFQVCLPLTLSAVVPFFPNPSDVAKVIPGFNAAMRAEIKKMVEKIPPNDLAIQWDCAVETALLEDGLGFPTEHALERALAPIPELSPHIPEQVALGYHVCFGTLGGWPMFQPKNLKHSVEFANGAVAASRRRVDFVHIPTLGTSDDGFFAPLADLRVSNARVYLGMIHRLHNIDGIKSQIKAARKYLRDFGIAAPCGFGRNSAEEMPQVLKDHLAAIEVFRELSKR